VIGSSWNVCTVFGTAKTKSGKWIDEEADIIFFCPGAGAAQHFFNGQWLQVEARLVFPAKPCGQVFWIRRAKARRNIIDLSFSIIGNQYKNLQR
jgi:hypothetical protein